MTARTWTVGDPEPPNSECRAVTGRSGTVWIRSEPAGRFWAPRSGGFIRHWPELLEEDGPVAADVAPSQGLLFEIAAAS